MNDLTNEWWKPLWRLAQAVANAPHGTSFKLTAKQAIKDYDNSLLRGLPILRQSNT